MENVSRESASGADAALDAGEDARQADAAAGEQNGAAQAADALPMTPEEEFLAAMLAGRDLSDLRDPQAEEAALQERLDGMSEEELQAYYEYEALETVFDDIRMRSSTGELTTPDYWECVGLVPDHMEAQAFTALVFDTIIEAQAHGGEANDAAEEAVRAEDAEEAVSAAGEGAPLADGAAAAEDAAAIGEPSAAGQANAAEHANVPDDSAEQGEAPNAWELDDIQVLEGSDTYLYSTMYMTDAFAHWAFLAAEGDDVLTLVDNARTESKLYPRPLKAASLMRKPYYMDEARVTAAFEAAVASGLYPDIQTCQASNGDVYYYSTDHLSTPQAKALAEWYSVERARNV